MNSTPWLGLIQARTSSTRFPGKSLKLVDRIITTAKQFCEPVLVVPEEDLTAFTEVALRHDIEMIGGDKENVLDRFQQAIIELEASEEQYLFRITADTPWLSAEHGKALNNLAEYVDVDYASFVHVPEGITPELVSIRALMDLDTSDPYEQEHVTPGLYNHTDTHVCVYLKGDKFDALHSEAKLSIDTKAEYEWYLKHMGKKTYKELLDYAE